MNMRTALLIVTILAAGITACNTTPEQRQGIVDEVCARICAAGDADLSTGNDTVDTVAGVACVCIDD